MERPSLIPEAFLQRLATREHHGAADLLRELRALVSSRAWKEPTDVHAARESHQALDAFLASPEDPALASRLSAALQAWAESNPQFRFELANWVGRGLHETGPGAVHNIVSGGTFHGSVIQGSDFNSIRIFTSDPSAGPAER